MPSKRPVLRQQRRKRWPEPHGHGSSRPSFSISSVPEPTMRSPRLTRDSVSLGNPRRRLLVGSKGRPGVVIAVHDRLLPRGSGPWSRSQGGAAAASHFPTDAWAFGHRQPTRQPARSPGEPDAPRITEDPTILDGRRPEPVRRSSSPAPRCQPVTSADRVLFALAVKDLVGFSSLRVWLGVARGAG
jgi:hypothetical protein